MTDEKLRREFEGMLRLAHWTRDHRDIDFDRDRNGDYESYPVHIAWNTYLTVIFRYSQPAPSVPAGWKLVPIEATKEMFNAASQYVTGSSTYGFEYPDELYSAYRAMLAASPEPNHD